MTLKATFGMPTTYLPPEDHIVRYVRSKFLTRDEDGKVITCSPEAFRLRDDEDYLSVDWLEHYDGSRHERLRQVKHYCDLTIKKSDGLGTVLVRDFHATCASVNVSVRICHERTVKDPAHSAIRQFPRDNEELLALLANIVLSDLVFGRDLPAWEP